MSVSSPARHFAGEIRARQPEDCARIAELAGQLGYASASEDIARRMAEMHRSSEQCVFVAQLASGVIAGGAGVFVYYSVETDAQAEISGIVVDEHFRSRGIVSASSNTQNNGRVRGGATESACFRT